jgi:hypothetical protein
MCGRINIQSLGRSDPPLLFYSGGKFTMPINVAENTINVAESDNVAGEVKRGRGRPKNAVAMKYWGQGAYYNCTMHLDPEVGKQLKIMAIQENTSMGRLVSEAVAVWIKWLRKAALEEAKLEDHAEAEAEVEAEYQEIVKIVKAIRTKKWVKEMVAAKRKKMAKAMRSCRSWRKEYPKRPWPGKVGNVAEKIVP